MFLNTCLIKFRLTSKRVICGISENTQKLMITMEPVNNNQYELRPANSKRKMTTPSTNVYLNPALDLLVNDDPMCNTAMEIVPNKKRKRTRSCNIASFENSALDLGISKKAINEFLVRELDNVRRNIKSCEIPEAVNYSAPDIHANEPIYANVSGVEVNINSDIRDGKDAMCYPIQMSDDNMEINVDDSKLDSSMTVLNHKTLQDNAEFDLSAIKPITQTNITNNILINNPGNSSLSFIDRLALDSPSVSDENFILDDDLNESNIMEIKTITIITKKKKIEKKNNTNPFLNDSLDQNDANVTENPFLSMISEPEYNAECSLQTQDPIPQNMVPRRLFVSDLNSTMSTINESVDQNIYENIDNYRTESPIYENVPDENDLYSNKQSKILGCDVSQFSAEDIMNLNRLNNQSNSSTESNDSKKAKYPWFKASNKLSKKVLKTLKRTFKNDHKTECNSTLNPYEVPRKPQKQKVPKESGIENPCLNLDNSDEIEIEELDGDHEYETIKTLRNTRLNMNVTPLKEKAEDNDASQNKSNTPGKKVRFNSTLNQEKIITGNSFDLSVQSPGFDAKIDKFHDELENCINERKFLKQNM